MSRPPQEALFGFSSLHEKLRQLQLDATLTTETSADGTTTTTLRMVVPGVSGNRTGAARARHHYKYRQGRKERKKQTSDRGSTEKASINTQAAAVLESVVTDTRKPLPAQQLPAPPPGLGAPGLGASTLGAPSPGPGAHQLGAEPEKESLKKTHSTAVLAPDVKDTRQPSPAQPLPAPLQPAESAMGAPNPAISTTRRPSPYRHISPSPSCGNGEKTREQIRSEIIRQHARFRNNPAAAQQNRIIQEAEIEKRRLLKESRSRPSYHKEDIRRQDDIIRQAKDTMNDIGLANNF